MAEKDTTETKDDHRKTKAGGLLDLAQDVHTLTEKKAAAEVALREATDKLLEAWRTRYPGQTEMQFTCAACHGSKKLVMSASGQQVFFTPAPPDLD